MENSLHPQFAMYEGCVQVKREKWKNYSLYIVSALVHPFCSAGTSFSTSTFYTQETQVAQPAKSPAIAKRALTSERPSPSEFRAEVHRRGWSFREIAERWSVSETYLNRVCRSEQRPPKWEDAIHALPYLSSRDGSSLSQVPSPKQMSPAEFIAEAHRKGWNPRDLAERWDVTRPYIKRLAYRPDRAVHWDEALRGLPHMLAIVKGQALEVIANEWL